MGLYLAIFGVVVGGQTAVGSLNYLTFVYVGLLATLVINGSFSNPSFALIIAKNVGTIASTRFRSCLLLGMPSVPGIPSITSST